MPQKTAKLSMLSLIVYNLTGGRIQMNSATDPVGVLELTTKGRKSGQLRKVSLVYIKSGSAYVVSGSNAGRDQHPAWFFNLRSDPQVLVRIKKQQISAVAEIVGPEHRRALWEQLVTASPMFSRYEKLTQREIPMVLLRPHNEGEKM
jgi:deazaflavin-dependent oxidoreductase (nitroreductase family)